MISWYNPAKTKENYTQSSNNGRHKKLLTNVRKNKNSIKHDSRLYLDPRHYNKTSRYKQMESLFVR